MGSVTSEDDNSDQQSDRCRSYSPSGSETSSQFSGRASAAAVASSSSLGSSPFKLARASAAAAPASLFWDGSDGKMPKRDAELSEIEMMRERFAKLLLGEDMSGGGKGVCTALAIANAITNLSATVFGELWRLEPLAPQKKALWLREMDWLLCVSDSIVELYPSVQEFPGRGAFEVMLSRQRSDLHMNLPALRKLDAMLIEMLNGFRDTEFWYIDRGILVADRETNGDGAYPSSSFARMSLRQEEKWWLPCPQVPPNGLSVEGRKRLQQCRDCANQILKAALAINNGVLAEMEIPNAYLETLPKTGKACLGEIIHHYLTADQFSPDCLLDSLDLSSEHHTLEIANRIEAAVYMWRLRDQKGHPLHPKKSWSGKVKGLVSDTEKNKFLSQQAEGLLQSLRLRYPGLPQTVLDMNKIQYNKDVGHSILESYSRVMESLAFNVMARIDDLIYVDDLTKRCVAAEGVSLFNRGGFGGLPIQKKILPSPFSIQSTPYATPIFCSSTPVASPGRPHPSLSKSSFHGQHDVKSGKPISGGAEKVWSYAGNVSSRNDSGSAPERDRV